MSLTQLLAEDGTRWMSPSEQFRVFPASRELSAEYVDRPVWLVLSIGLREQGYRFSNGFGVSGQMRNIRLGAPKEGTDR